MRISAISNARPTGSIASIGLGLPRKETAWPPVAKPAQQPMPTKHAPLPLDKLSSATGDQVQFSAKAKARQSATQQKPLGTVPTRTTRKQPHFSGQVSTLHAALGVKAENGFYGSLPLTGRALHTIVETDTNPYVGETPMMLQARSHLNHYQLCRKLDDLAEQLREQEDAPLIDRLLHELSPFSTKVPLNGLELKVHKIGEGSFGTVYKISEGGHDYAFKVYKDIANEHLFSDHSPYQEAANGVYLTIHNINKDVVRYYAGNPQDSWALTEYVPEHGITDNREGKSLKEAGFAMSDDHLRNRVHNVRVDLGGNLQQSDNLFDTSTYYRVYSST